MSTNKDHVRELYYLKRKRIPEHSRVEMDLKIRDNFFETFNFKTITIIHTYLSIADRIEVDTFPITDRLSSDYPNVKIVVPFAVMSDHSLKHLYWHPGEPLVVNKWKIPEPDPESCMEAEINDIDLVIVPLLAYDLKGHRVGYGAGFYDRFLVDCKDETLIVGLSHFAPEDQWIKFEEYDIDLNYCITPDEVYKF